MKLNDIAYLQNIGDAIAAIEKYASVHTFEQLSENEWDQAALLKYLEIIAEASK